jgi:hypothetical protein
LLWVRCRGLEHALRAADLLIQGGGFGFIALDLSDIAPETVRHVPLNAWFRFRRAVEDTSTVLLLLEQESNAKTCASLVLQMKRKAARWSAAPEGVEQEGQAEISREGFVAHACLLEGADVQAEMIHTRMQSINMPRVGKEPVSITAGRSESLAGRDSDAAQSFSAQSMWSYLHAMPVEAKIK